MRRTWWVVLALLFLVPIAAWAAKTVALTPNQTPVRLTETKDFTAVVTGTSNKTVKFKVCDGAGKNCVVNGNTTVGTLTALSPDANGNPQVRYTAPATLPAITLCQSVVLGCQVKIKAVLEFTKKGITRRRKASATVTLAAPGVIRRASLAAESIQANGPSSQATASYGGRYVAFNSTATNLAPGDAPDSWDVFARDTCLGAPAGCTPTTVLASAGYDGSPPNGFSGAFYGGWPMISANGRFVVFGSYATNLVPDDTNGLADVFLRDTCLGAEPGCTPSTARVNVGNDGSQDHYTGISNFHATITADGRFVAFNTTGSLVVEDPNFIRGLYLRDTCAGVPTGCTPATSGIDAAGGDATLSADGRFITYGRSFNLFLRDTCRGAPPGCTPALLPVTVTVDGEYANDYSNPGGVSADGRFVVFTSRAPTLVPDDTNGAWDAFVRDTCIGAPPGCTPSTVRVNVASDGTQSDQNNTVPGPSISSDGRFVCFSSDARNLVPDDTNAVSDLFLRDTCWGAPPGCTPSSTSLSVAPDGMQGNGQATSVLPRSLSPDGRMVALGSEATNLVAGDTNNVEDAFVGRTGFVRPPLAYVAHGVDPAGKMSIIDTGSNSTIATLDVGGEPVGVAITPDGLRAYVTNVVANNVSVINTLSNTVAAVIPVGMRPLLPAVTPDGTRVYVANFDTNDVSVIDTGSNSVVATIPVGSGPGGVLITADGARAYVSNESTDDVSVIDTTTNTVVATIAVGDGPHGLALSPDGMRLYVGNGFANTVSVINTATNAVAATITVGTDPAGLVVTPDGTRLYVANTGSDSVSVVDTAANSVVATLPVAARPSIFALASDGPTLYLTHDSAAVGAVTVIDVASNTVKTTIPIGASAGAGIALRLVR